MSVYGYCRISTPQQNIERQVRNITAAYPEAHIVREVYTGTACRGRQELDKLLHCVQPGDTIVFDSVSRMSRSAEEGCALYEELYARGVNLCFLKEPHINTDTYKQALQRQINASPETGSVATDRFVSGIMDALNRYTSDLAKEQIRLAFAQAQKEVDDLHQRTREGILTARLNGKQIGQMTGRKLHVKKADTAKALIQKHSRDFGGTLSDADCIKLIGIARNTYYKYKRELRGAVAHRFS
jgi:DNA invertase Pin-like site-specific DNA recombinase